MIRRLARRLRAGWVAAYRYLEEFEPARLIAVRTALLQLAAALGITLTTGTEDRVGYVFAAAAAALALLQGLHTRARVTPVDRGQAPADAGAADDLDEEVDPADEDLARPGEPG